MASFVFQTGATDKTIAVRAYDSTTFLPETGLVYNSAGLTCYFREGATGSATQLTLATQTVGGAHSDGGFVLIDDTNMPGVYRLDLSDTILNSGAGSHVTVHLKATGVVFEPIDIFLTADDPTAAAATVAQIADGVWDEAKAGHTTADTYGKLLADADTNAGTAATNSVTLITDVGAIVEDVFARAFEATKMSGLTFEEIIGLVASAILGKSSGVAAGSPVYRNLGDTANAVASTATDGDRSAVTLTAASVR